eukprot:scaffold65577_cov66-Phaeocystis_antarctica.AAC.8
MHAAAPASPPQGSCRRPCPPRPAPAPRLPWRSVRAAAPPRPRRDRCPRSGRARGRRQAHLKSRVARGEQGAAFMGYSKGSSRLRSSTSSPLRIAARSSRSEVEERPLSRLAMDFLRTRQRPFRAG